MNSKDLKQAIADDIEGLKNFDIDIMESKEYYGALRREACRLFLWLWLTFIGTKIFWIPVQWKEFIQDPLYAIGFLTIGSALVALLFVFIAFLTLSDLVLFKYQMKPKLKTGQFLWDEATFAGRKVYFWFVGLLMVANAFIDWPYVLGVEFGVTLVSIMIAKMLFELELRRVGISALFTVIREYFDKDKKKSYSEYRNE